MNFNYIKLFTKKCLAVYSLAAILALSGCATTPYHKRYHNYSPPYKPYSQTGEASFYGYKDGFDGQQMANGETFHADNPHTASHPSLPLGTKLKVVNLQNKKSIYVEVKDRMGHVSGRIIDLSYGAGKYLGMKKSGLVKVQIKSVTDQEYKKNI